MPHDTPLSTSTDPRVDPRLDRLAEIAVQVGLGGFTPGQELVLTASVEALPLVRRIVAQAYKAGASLVTPFFSDDECALARYRFAADGSFDVAPGWMYDGMATAFRNGAARLAVVGEDPNLLAGQDVEKVSRANRARSTAYRPALELITASAINWTLVPFASAAWARTVFPELDEAAAVAKLWEALYASTRVDQPDPTAAWAAHNAALMQRRNQLNARRFRALHFKGPGTDLTVGLADNHSWMGGSSKARNGITGNPNIPTEEVFTTPHAAMTEGTVAATKPLAHQGTLIRDIRVRFEGGRVVEAQASSGEAVLRKMIGTDEGACRLGEVALVPHSSPISQSGLLFFNTLFDENAACHIALGQAYKKCFTDSESMTEADFAARGGNSSLIHVDWMIGSGQVDIDGIGFDGSRQPVMRQGEWA